ncbi:protein translocase subunit TIM13 [Aspergillus thermomutatus]|uniref:Mitochondrial import inner membrane translocase subunit n=1 Tax=Aspergillus thermomutatus TaxID=41047 RepID=A0A397GKA4_ASPTH|nr:protein translocase subunit [Aspergillus thermomutatus]RHZ51325.1 protein translocase subunit [Aspergillus thermomutatus]
MAIWGSSSSNTPSASEADVKTHLMNQVRQEAAMTNARNLIGKVNEHCFEACVPNPGTSLSSAEHTCLSQCMEKYISFWNAVSRSYISRLSTERKAYSGSALDASFVGTGQESSL